MRLNLTVLFFASLAALALLASVGCGNSGCPNNGSGGTGTGSGTSSGTTVTSTCGGSGGGGGTTSGSVFVYYVDGNGAIQGADLSTSGTLAAFTNYTAPSQTFTDAESMVIVNNAYLYVPQKSASDIRVYSINRDNGALSEISGSPFSTSGGDTVASDPLGRFLFLTDSAGGGVSVFQISSSTGGLTQTSGSPFASPVVFGWFPAVDGAGKYLYIAQNDPALPTAGFSFDQSSGALTAVPGSPLSLAVSAVRPESSGAYMVGATGDLTDFHLYLFSIESGTGVLAAVPGSPFTTQFAPYNYSMSPVAPFVYSFGVDSTGAAQAPEGYTINLSSGTLTAVSGSPFTSLPAVDVCGFDPSGVYMFCPEGTTSIAIFTANTTTGGLSSTVTPLTVNMGSNIVFAAMD